MQTQIYLLSPPVIDDLLSFSNDLDAVLTTGHVACFQLRLKDISDDDVVRIGTAVRDICQVHNVPILMNDRPDLAKRLSFDGAHIGQDDMPYRDARELLGKGAIIGVTCHNSKELAFTAAGQGANYIAFGAFFETATKSPKTHASVELLEFWRDTMEIPCVAIGGMTAENAGDIAKAGADFIAVSSGVWAAKDGPVKGIEALWSAISS